MAIIRFSNGVTVNFNGNPTQADIEEVARGFQTQEPQQEQANPYNAVFRATGQEGGIKSGLKAIGNLPTSAYTLGKNIVGAVTSPIQTAKGVGNLIADTGAVVTNKLTDLTGGGTKRDQSTARALGNAYFGEDGRYGSFANTQKTTIEDPFGVGSDILAVLQGGAGLTGKTAQLNNVLSKTAKVATAPIRVPVKAAARATGSAARFSASQATGLTPETIGTIVDNPKGFSAAQASGATRVDLADDVFSAIKKAGDELSDLGTGYDAIRKSGQIVSLADDWLTKSLDDFGLKVKYDNAPAVVNGVPDLNTAPKTTIVADRTSKTRNVTDINKIQSFVDNWGSSKTFTAEEYLNMRSDLAELAKYDMAGTTVARDFGTRVREGVLNSDKVRKQISGLKDLDAKYSEDVKFFKKMEKEFLNPDGKLKDGAASKVVNAVNASNPERLARLERLYPGFTKQARVIKAVEDVENAMGLKVGSYTRAGVAVAGVATGNLPLILGAILSTPEIIVPLLKGLGYTSKTIGPILAAIRDFAGDINNFRVPGAIEEYMKKNYKDGVPVGMSTKNVGVPKGTTDSDLVTMREYSDMVFDKKTKLPDAIQIEIEDKMSEVAKRLGLKNSLGSKEALANEASKILDNAQFAETLPKPKATPPTTLLESKDGYLYHGTNESILDNIKKDGLKPGMRGQLSVSTTEDYAKTFAREGMTPTGKTESVLLRVKSDALSGKTTTKRVDGKERPFPDQQNELLTKETISPENLEIYKDGKWQPLLDKQSTLLEEAKKYKSAEEFVEAINNKGDDSFVTPTVGLKTKTGEPQLIRGFHGTNKQFDKFEIPKDGVRYTGDGVYFSPDSSGATSYGNRVVESYLDLKNPYVLRLPEGNIDFQPGNERIREIIADGHDSIIVRSGKGEDDIINEIVVFDLDAIKTKEDIIKLWESANPE